MPYSWPPIGEPIYAGVVTTLVVQAHPVEDSFSGALFNAVVDELATRQQPVTTVQIGHGEQLTGDSLTAIEHLIAIYPTWYGSLPAVFLDAMVQLLSPWVDGAESPQTSPLRTVRSLKVITSHGSSKLVNVVQGEPGLLLWKRTVLPLCAPGATFDWKALYKLDRNSAAARTTFLSQAADLAAS